MKIEWSITHVTLPSKQLWSPLLEQTVVFKKIFDVFWLIQVACVVGGPCCDLEIPS